ncbi:hypothetical protein Tco_0315843 [Tanacetum coccineum]
MDDIENVQTNVIDDHDQVFETKIHEPVVKDPFDTVGLNELSNYSDPFGLDFIIKKKNGKVTNLISSKSLVFPPGFTPTTTGNQQTPESFHNISEDGVSLKQPGFSMLERLEETIKVGLDLGIQETKILQVDLCMLRQNQSEEEVAEAMREPTMEEYMMKTREYYGSRIARPKIDDKAHFELKGQFLKELRDNTFSGLDNEDVNEHIDKVLEIVDLIHIPEVTQDQIMLRVFPMSLTGAASRWLRNEPSGSIITWEILKNKFLSKYCPPARTAKKMEEINNFQQEYDKTLYQAWERFKELLQRCPQHYLTDMQEVIWFYKGLDVPTRQILDSKGAIPSMKAADAKKAIQDMADHS